MAHIRHWVFPSHVCPTIYDCSNVSASTHLTGPWRALHAPECVVCVCHTSSLLWMWYAQVWFQAVRSISIPYLNRLVSPERSWSTLKLCWGVYHTSNPLCSTEVCCGFLSVTQCHQLWHHVAYEVEAEDTQHLLVCHHHNTVPLEKTSGNIYILMGKYGGRVNRLNRTESWDIIDIHYITSGVQCDD